MLLDTTTGNLYVAGDFGILQTDSTRFNGVARWDGQQLHQLNGGIGGYTSGLFAVSPAFAIAQYQGNVVVGGAFDNLDSVPNTDNIGGWNGVSWVSLGTTSSTNAAPRGFTVIDDELHVTGGMDSIAGIYMPSWAIWDGSTWRCADTTEVFDPGLYKVQKYQGQLYAGGNFDLSGGRNDLVRLTANGWEEPGPGLLGDCWVIDMEIYDGLLWVSGYFFQAAGNPQSCIMAWDGTQWLAPFPQIDAWAQGHDLLVANGKLYGAGPFDVVGKQDFYGIWEYDGSQVCVIGGPKVYASALAASPDTLYMGGCTTLYCDGVSQNVGCIAKWPLDAPADTCFTLHVGVREVGGAQGGASLHPNPLTSTALLQLPTGSALSEVLIWHDALGRLVRTDPPNWQGNALLIERGGLPPGLYLLRYGAAPAQTLRVVVH